MHRGDFAPKHTPLGVQKFQVRAKIMPRESRGVREREREEGYDNVI